MDNCERPPTGIEGEVLGLLAENMGEAFCLCDRNFRIVWLNHEAVRLDGRPLHDLIGKTLWEAWPGALATVVEKSCRRAMAGESLAFEHRYQSDVHDVWLSCRVIPTRAGLALFYRDIGKDRRSAERFAVVNRQLNAVLDNATVAIFLMDEHQHCAYMNAAAERLTGYNLAETQGRPLHHVIHHTRPDGSHYPLEECPIDRAFPEDNHEQGEEVFVHKDGRFYTVAFTASPIRNEAAKTIGTIIEVRDVTAQKAAAAAHELLMREVDHRARNALSVVQAMLRLTQAPDLETFRSVVAGRVDALARSQGMLAAQKWQGASLRDLVSEELAALVPSSRFALHGPNVMLLPEQAQPLSMLFHELVTNALKHGSLSHADGSVSVSWMLGASLRIAWKELGGAGVKEQPRSQGFGTRMIDQAIKQSGGTVRLMWEPDGLNVELKLPPP